MAGSLGARRVGPSDIPNLSATYDVAGAATAAQTNAVNTAEGFATSTFLPLAGGTLSGNLTAPQFNGSGAGLTGIPSGALPGAGISTSATPSPQATSRPSPPTTIRPGRREIATVT